MISFLPASFDHMVSFFSRSEKYQYFLFLSDIYTLNFHNLFDHLISLVESTYDWWLPSQEYRRAEEPETVLLPALPMNAGCSSLIDYLVQASC